MGITPQPEPVMAVPDLKCRESVRGSVSHSAFIVSHTETYITQCVLSSAGYHHLQSNTAACALI